MRGYAERVGYGPYWARTSDLRLVETVPYSLRIDRNAAPHAAPRRIVTCPGLGGIRRVSAGLWQRWRLTALSL